MPDAIVAPPATTEPFLLSFGIKSAQEVTHDGQEGLLLEGYASRFGEQDQDGETMTQHAFSDIAETWGAEPEPLILYHHGMDPALGMRRIGKAIAWHVDTTGLYVKSFLPKVPRFTTASAVQRFREVYDGIKAGRIRGYSVGGFCTTLGKTIVKWSKNELSITPRPCLATATFTLGSKAVKDYLGDTPLTHEAGGDVMPALMTNGPMSEQSTSGVLSRPAFNTVMRAAQVHKDHALHDHLMSRPAHLQGSHDGMQCPICEDRRSAMGIKAQEVPPVVPPSPTKQTHGQKAIEEAQQVLARYTAAVKAGRRFSATSKASIQTVIDLLHQLIAEEAAEDDETGEPTMTPAGKAMRITVGAQTTDADWASIRNVYDEWASNQMTPPRSTLAADPA